MSKKQTNDIRDHVIKILSRVFSEEDVLKYDKEIFNLIIRTAKNEKIKPKFSDPRFREIQKKISLEMTDRLIIAHKNSNGSAAGNETLNKLFHEMKNIEKFDSKSNWDTVLFNEYRDKRYQYDQMLTNPAEIEEGIYTCKCGSKKTYHKALQTRSGDEGMTIFITCQDCSHKWKVNN